MKILRLFFFLLILVNLVFLAWSQGYFDGATEVHEPYRLEQQLNAEKMRIVDEGQATAPPVACQVLGGLTKAAVEQIERDAAVLGGETRRLQPQDFYRVVIAGLTDQTVADTKKFELLSRLPQVPSPLNEIQVQMVSNVPSARYEILLGIFIEEVAARDYVALLAGQGIASARWEKPNPLAPSERVEMQVKAEVLTGQLKMWIAQFPSAMVMHCAQ